MSDINRKLLAIQCSMRCGKTQFNSFGGFSYRSAEGILEALKPHLNEQGLTVNLTDDIRIVGDRIYVAAMATLTDIETGDFVCAQGWAREPASKKGMDDSQVTGTASSYARKYALNGLLALDDNKDADTDEYGKQTGKEGPCKCSACKSEITEVTLNNGTVASPADFAGWTKITYGKILCSQCHIKEQAKRKAAREAAMATSAPTTAS